VGESTLKRGGNTVVDPTPHSPAVNDRNLLRRHNTAVPNFPYPGEKGGIGSRGRTSLSLKKSGHTYRIQPYIKVWKQLRGV